MRQRLKRRSSPAVRVTMAALVLSLCSLLATSKLPTALETVRQHGKLNVIARNGPTTFYEGPLGLTGFEYTLTKAFAEDLGVELNVVYQENLGTLLNSVGVNGIDVAASGLTVTENRLNKVRFGTSYLNVTQQVIYRGGSRKPESTADLIGQDILVIADSAHAERMHELRDELPELRWREQADLEMIDLMEMVHSGKVQYAIVDSNAFSLNRAVYPLAQVAFEISEPQQIAWAFPKTVDDSLYNAAQDFFARIEANGRLEQIREQHYSHVDQMNIGGSLVFSERVESRLPKWEPFLKAAGETYDIDWRLLAAISYQESHWNSSAKSHTGVRGLMMLTQATAKDLGIENRIDPVQSIDGGARYFKSILERIPARVQGNDRTWMALAAYNVGLGHLEDARVLTARAGDNPNKWADVQRYLPLLAKRKYYKDTKHGFARGWEPVVYVENIRHFYNVLAWHEHMQDRRLAMTEREFQEVVGEAANDAALSL